MSNLLDMVLPERTEVRLERELATCNKATKAFGLELSHKDAAALEVQRLELLNRLDRVEFGESAVVQLSAGFASSPYLRQDNYAAELEGLQECFYELRSLAGPEVFDEEIIDGMRLLYDGDAGGAIELLNECTLEMVMEAYDTQTGSLAERNREIIENEGPVSDVPSYEWNISEVLHPDDREDLDELRFNEQEWHDNIQAPGFDGERWDDDLR